MKCLERFAVTGASAGFGRSLCETVLRNGENVVAVARRTHLLNDLVDRYSTDRILVVKMDVTNPEDVSRAFSEAARVFGRVDVVFNNAGYADLGEMESMPDAQARAMVETNFWGAVNVTREAIRAFREVNPPGSGGRLLQMSSIYGVVSIYCEAFYTASKHALEGFTKCIAQELDPAWNIKITILEPEYFRSEINVNLKWSPPHPAYQNLALPGTRMRANWNAFVPNGDPRKAAGVFYRVAALPDPPLQLPVGQEAIAMFRKMLAEFGEEITRYESLSSDLLFSPSEDGSG
ncbi:NAD-P-binding protein [Trametes polyzona]|nr:NAD-P-binding protein [Trametes polyzona]